MKGSKQRIFEGVLFMNSTTVGTLTLALAALLGFSVWFFIPRIVRRSRARTYKVLEEGVQACFSLDSHAETIARRIHSIHTEWVSSPEVAEWLAGRGEEPKYTSQKFIDEGMAVTIVVKSGRCVVIVTHEQGRAAFAGKVADLLRRLFHMNPVVKLGEGKVSDWKLVGEGH